MRFSYQVKHVDLHYDDLVGGPGIQPGPDRAENSIIRA